MAQIPTMEQSERAVLDAIAEYNIRPNEIVPVMAVRTKAMARGLSAAEANAALESMQRKGWLILTAGSPHMTVTSAGFAAI